MARISDDPLVIGRWLQTHPSLEDLKTRFPENWEVVERRLSAAVRDRDQMQLDSLMRPFGSGLPTSKERKPNKQEVREFIDRLVQQRMAAIAIERFLNHALTDLKREHINRLDRVLFRCLFFTGDYQRKLVSPLLFRVLWPLVRHPNVLRPLAEAHGIYCFYSAKFISGLADAIDGRRCIEIGAGDGALARYLRAIDVEVLAFDNFSWRHRVRYGADVHELDAATALRETDPEVVICSYPPAMNDFERHVFAASSVKRYIVIGNRQRHSFGDWLTYQSQGLFSLRLVADLSALLIPHEFDGAVYFFDRE